MGERRSGETAAVLGLGTAGAGVARPQVDCIVLTCVLTHGIMGTGIQDGGLLKYRK